jgi:transcriptional regulator with PAS, ATPase and Fis domain
VLFDLKRDVTELKKLFLEALQGNADQGDILTKHADLFKNVAQDDLVPYTEANRLLPSPVVVAANIIDIEEDKEADVLDVTHEAESTSFSLDKQEKEMIVKALRMHHNKRKYAAQALGISERTLYRKIKQYDLEEM